MSARAAVKPRIPADRLFTSLADRALPVVRPVLVSTSGRPEVAVKCPNCEAWHRHLSLGAKRAPCGARYDVRPRRLAQHQEVDCAAAGADQ